MDQQSDLPSPEILERADLAYRPFREFRAWSTCQIDPDRWSSVQSIINGAKQADAASFERAFEIVKRVAAIETGAIEGLYEVDTGFTFTAAREMAIAGAAGEGDSDSRRRLIESQINAYEYVLDFATHRVPINEAWIRQLHAVMCANQDTYAVQTSAGPQQQQLPKGKYKTHPNHVRTPDGTIHSYAPVIDTPIEMQTFVAEVFSDAFTSAHPIQQAAFAHHAFVTIHPFPDGNGRVARALASVFLMRAASIPLLVLVEQKREYLAGLRAADDGKMQPFVDFLLSRAWDTAILLEESLKTAAKSTDTLALAEEVTRLYVTQGGYTHAAVDEAANRLLTHLGGQLSLQAEKVAKGIPGCGTNAGFSRNNSLKAINPGYRMPVAGINTFQVRIVTPPPADADWTLDLSVEIPISGKTDSPVCIVVSNQNEIQVRLGDLIPALTSITIWLATMFVERVMSDGLRILKEKGENSLRTRGFL